WIWQCHECQRIYSIGATRRCLEDGHYFCCGTTTKNWRKSLNPKKATKQRHRLYANEFDYAGWGSVVVDIGCREKASRGFLVSQQRNQLTFTIQASHSISSHIRSPRKGTECI
ncbi:hypothetical protein P154DRAFT_451593, partial [Amniculicola lignicola CBS 123094]